MREVIEVKRACLLRCAGCGGLLVRRGGEGWGAAYEWVNLWQWDTRGGVLCSLLATNIPTLHTNTVNTFTSAVMAV